MAMENTLFGSVIFLIKRPFSSRMFLSSSQSCLMTPEGIAPIQNPIKNIEKPPFSIRCFYDFPMLFQDFPANHVEWQQSGSIPAKIPWKTLKNHHFPQETSWSITPRATKKKAARTLDDWCGWRAPSSCGIQGFFPTVSSMVCWKILENHRKTIEKPQENDCFSWDFYGIYPLW